MIAECPRSETCAAPSFSACAIASRSKRTVTASRFVVGGVELRERGEVLLGALVEAERRQRVAGVRVEQTLREIRVLVAVLRRDRADRVGDHVRPRHRRRHESCGSLVTRRSAHAGRPAVDLREGGERADRLQRDRAVVDARVQVLVELEDLQALADQLARDLQPLADALARQSGLQQPREGARLLDRRVLGAVKVGRQRVDQAAGLGPRADGSAPGSPSAPL